MRISDWSSDVCSSDLDAYVAPLYRFCLARVGNETDAEDLTEEIFLKVMRAVAKFEWRPLPLGANGEERSPFRAWIFRIARNHRSEERRVGKESGSTLRSRWSPNH